MSKIKKYSLSWWRRFKFGMVIFENCGGYFWGFHHCYNIYIATSIKKEPMKSSKKIKPSNTYKSLSNQ